MSVFTRKSTSISNRDATPTVPNEAAYDRGMLRCSEGYVHATSGDSANSYYPICSVPSNARVHAVKFQCDALGAGAELNIGVFAPTSVPPSLIADGYTSAEAINATLFASALSVATAVAIEEVTNQSGSNTINIQEQELWQALGLSADPNCDLDIGMQVAVAIATTGYAGLKVEYAL